MDEPEYICKEERLLKTIEQLLKMFDELDEAGIEVDQAQLDQIILEVADA